MMAITPPNNRLHLTASLRSASAGAAATLRYAAGEAER